MLRICVAESVSLKWWPSIRTLNAQGSDFIVEAHILSSSPRLQELCFRPRTHEQWSAACSLTNLIDLTANLHNLFLGPLPLVQQLTALRRLIISAGCVEDAEFAYLQSLTCLEVLCLTGMRFITNAVFDHIARIPRLHTLSVTTFSSMSMAGIEQCTRLKRLLLAGPFSQDDTQHIANMSAVECVQLTVRDAASIRSIFSMRSLRKLVLEVVCDSDLLEPAMTTESRQLEGIRNMCSLQELGLPRLVDQDEVLAMLEPLKELARLTVAQDISERRKERLFNMLPKLERIQVEYGKSYLRPA